MSMDRPKLKAVDDALMPVNWAAIEPHYRAGIRSLRDMGAEFGVTPAGIRKHFKARGVLRDLKARIHYDAQEKVNRAAVNALVDAQGVVNRAATEGAIIDAASNVLAHVQIAHRRDIGRARARVLALFAELDEMCDRPDLHAMVHLALSDPDDKRIGALYDMAALVASLPARTKIMKDLAEVLTRLIGAEREAFGLDTASGTDGRPMVIIRDYTGRGDPDAPRRIQAPE